MRATLAPFFWPAGAGTEPAGPPPADRKVLGHDGTRHFVVMPDGTVAWVDPAMPLATHFVNSSAFHFEASLEALVNGRAELEQADADGAIIAVSSLRHELNRIDISALGDRDNFWAVVLDQLEDEVP